MKIKLLSFILFSFIGFTSMKAQQITELWTNYDGFWTSSSTSINPVKPDNYHELLAFKYGSTIYSTSVNDNILTNQGITFTPAVYRALPVASLPTSGGTSYYVGFGQLADGIDNGTDNGPSNPFAPITKGSEVANFLTDGINGLELGTNITNIPSGTTAVFKLSSNGISLPNIDDNVPDVIVSQTAQPSGSGSNFDKLSFVDASGNLVGNVVTIDFTSTSEPKLGDWNPDFYNFNSTGNGGSSLTNGTRPIHLKAIELSDFGIDASNYQNAVELRYQPRGSSDPSFIAFNEPSLGVASQLNVLDQPTSQNCDGSLASPITVQLEDNLGAAVPQEGIEITASLYSGPGDLLGTLVKTTNTIGVATFDDLHFSVGAPHKIEFSYSSLESGISQNIDNSTSCTDYVWNGNTNSQWNVATNWTPNGVPNGNNAVNIPNGRSNYPVLQADAGSGDLVMGSSASIDLNGHLLVLNGSLTIDNGAQILANALQSTLYISSSAALNIPANLLSSSIANFKVENAGGVTINSTMDITESLELLEGTISTNGLITMKCSFASPSRTAVIQEVNGTFVGDIVTEQCYPAKRSFRMVSPSATTATSMRANWQEDAINYLDVTTPGYGTHITGVSPGSSNATTTQDGNDGFDYNPSGNSSIFYFDNLNQTWQRQPNTTTNLTAGQAYRVLIRGDRTIDITSNQAPATDTRLRETGEVVTGTQNLSGFNSTEGAFNFIGNPYHAQVDMNKVLNNSKNINSGVIYYWDPTINTYGGYVTVDLPDGSNSVGSEANQYMQVKQAAFVLTSSLNQSPEITFKESYKIKSSQGLSVFSEAENQISKSSFVNVKLYASEALQNSEKPYDGLRFNFSDVFSNTSEDDYPKLGNIDENLASVNDNFYAAIEYRKMPQDEELIDLFINNYRTLDYHLIIDIDGDLGKELYIIDHYLNEETKVTTSGFDYAFAVNPNIAESIDENRFQLKFKNVTLQTETPEFANLKVYPNPVLENSFEIQGLRSSADHQIRIYDNLGRQVYQKEIKNESKIKITNLNLSAGIYFVKLENLETLDAHKLKLIIK